MYAPVKRRGHDAYHKGRKSPPTYTCTTRPRALPFPTSLPIPGYGQSQTTPTHTPIPPATRYEGTYNRGGGSSPPTRNNKHITDTCKKTHTTRTRHKRSVKRRVKHMKRRTVKPPYTTTQCITYNPYLLQALPPRASITHTSIDSPDLKRTHTVPSQQG
jgi:hypothetical protein